MALGRCYMQCVMCFMDALLCIYHWYALVRAFRSRRVVCNINMAWPYGVFSVMSFTFLALCNAVVAALASFVRSSSRFRISVFATCSAHSKLHFH